MTGPDVATDTRSWSQLKADLWGSPDRRVHAVVIGARSPGLLERLEEAERNRQLADYDCLWPGALDDAQRQAAPYLIQLEPDSGLTDWLLKEVGAGLAHWGLLLSGTATQLQVRAHCRSLIDARLADGRTIRLEWYAPEVLQRLLPLADAHQLSAWFAVSQSLLLPQPGGWVRHRFVNGRLDSQVLRIAG